MSELEEKPLVTFALFACNQERYIRDAVEAALAQDYSPLQIILSDDGSSDATFQIMEEIVSGYEGPHLVRLNRNVKNLGVGEHVNVVMGMSEGSFVVLAAGDDVSLPQRTSCLIDEWIVGGAGTAVMYSDLIPINEGSLTVDMGSESSYTGAHSLASMASGYVRVLGATTAMTKDVFDRFPALSTGVIHEDRVLPFRALLLGGRAIFVDEKLVKYRVDGGISRQLPTSLHEYLHVYTPSSATRTLPDAIQRLSDALFAQPENRVLRHACAATIADHESKLDMHFNGYLRYEMVLFKWLFRGARRIPLLKHYLKMRFSSAFR